MKMEEDAHKLLAELKNRNESSTDENDMLKRIMDRRCEFQWNSSVSRPKRWKQVLETKRISTRRDGFL